MRVRVCTVVTTLALLLSVGAVKATTYAIPLSIAEGIWFPRLIFSNVDSRRGIDGIADGARGLPLLAENLAEFQIGVIKFNFSDLEPSDVLPPAQHGSESALISKAAIFAQAAGSFVEVESESSPYAKVRHHSVKPNAVYCRDAGCRGDTRPDSATALLFLSRPDWSIYMVGSDSFGSKAWKELLVEELLSPSAVRFKAQSVSSSHILILRTLNHF